MSKYEKRVLTIEDARIFINNMRWFAGYGRITTKHIDEHRVIVSATPAAWSNWVTSKEYYNVP